MNEIVRKVDLVGRELVPELEKIIHKAKKKMNGDKWERPIFGFGFFFVFSMLTESKYSIAEAEDGTVAKEDDFFLLLTR